MTPARSQAAEMVSIQTLAGLPWAPNMLPIWKFDPATAAVDGQLPADPVEVYYSFQMDLPNDVVKMDYMTRALTIFTLEMRLYDSGSGKAQITRLSDKVRYGTCSTKGASKNCYEITRHSSDELAQGASITMSQNYRWSRYRRAGRAQRGQMLIVAIAILFVLLVIGGVFVAQIGPESCRCIAL